jgi:hypothetical protein
MRGEANVIALHIVVAALSSSNVNVSASRDANSFAVALSSKRGDDARSVP